MKNLSDAELVESVRTECPDAYEEIICRYERKIFAYIYRFVREKEESEDIAQNVFVKVYLHLDEFDATRKFSSWIYRIAHNEAINFLKKRNRKHFVSWEDLATSKDKLEASSTERTPVEVWLRKEVREEVRAALRKLPVKYRRIIEMRYYKNESYGQMSRELKKPVNTVGTLLNRAKKKLSRVMREKRIGRP